MKNCPVGAAQRARTALFLVGGMRSADARMNFYRERVVENNSDHVVIQLAKPDTSVQTAMKVAVYQNSDGFLFACQEYFQNPWATRVSDMVEIPYVATVPANPRPAGDINKLRAVNDDLVEALQHSIQWIESLSPTADTSELQAVLAKANVTGAGKAIQHQHDTNAHTATPWAEFRDNPKAESVGYIRRADSDGYDGLEIAVLYGCGREDQQAANAAFIVRAVNAHDGLVAALKAAERIVTDRMLGGRLVTTKESACEVYKQIVAARAAAGAA